jgi:signal peptidase I
MTPTLQGNGDPGSDWVLSEKLTYLFRKPRRWEVVQFVTEDHLIVDKRVAGLPHEKISIRDQRVAINGNVLAVPPSLTTQKYYSYGKLHRGKEADCGDGYFLLGDESHDSADSRFDGPIPPERIKARAFLRVWPLSRIGFINP